MPSSIVAAYRRWADRVYWRLVAGLAPGLLNSHYAYARALSTELARATCWLDLGCGHDFLPPFVNRKTLLAAHGDRAIVGIDADGEALARHRGLRHRVRGDIQRLPFRTGSFDLATANMVVEHVEHPALLFDEIARVLRPGGRLLLHTPNADGYTTRLTQLIPGRLLRPLAGALSGRDVVDVYPTHYRANTNTELTRMLNGSQWRLERFDFVESSAQFAQLPPAAFLELTAIRAFRSARWQGLRACLLVVAERRTGG
jgi:SAM-dependent methyltransferase